MVGHPLLFRAARREGLTEPGTPVNLRYVTAVASFGLVAVSAAIGYALAVGHFRADGSTLLENPWGLATLVDIYVGFALFSCWVAWREPTLPRSLLWIGAIMLGGNVVSAIYVLLAARSSRGDLSLFWHGSNHDHLFIGSEPVRIPSKEESS